MHINRVQATLFILVFFAAGAFFHILYTRTAPTDTEQQTAGETEKDTLSANAAASSAFRDAELNAIKNSLEKKLKEEVNTVTHQISMLTKEIKLLQEQVENLKNNQTGENIHGEEVAKSTTPGIPEKNDQVESALSWASSRHGEEPRDEQWATAVEASISSEFNTNQNVTGISLETVDCRTNLCRVAWRYKEDATSEELFTLENEMLTAMNRAGFNSSTQHSQDGEQMEGYFWHTAPLENTSPGVGLN